ncbi:EAL domain-containing protein [Dyella psychrodurans]|uniref:EAL domain-containing protein n=1 Tax=Dyella psychrodurans TaxID=1927960 RepID=A0A370XD14_9GAMM|nr:EAL domain-containing protein [Dyella psychrodurans]RDS86192.1 EAL domain-containing protein [Dyella psychrodurans]
METCELCREGKTFRRAITMAFQPIVDLSNHTTFAHEALVRGRDGASASDVLSGVDDVNRFAFDQLCRMTALEWAGRLKPPALLSINFMPNAVYDAYNCMLATIATARRVDWPLARIIFEVNEQEAVADFDRLLVVLKGYRAQGILTAIDDFGAAYSGLNLLADFQPDLLKLDLALIKGISLDRARRAIIRHTVRMCEELGIGVIAEGVETADDSHALCDLGIYLQQGYLFARPELEALPSPHFYS